MVYRGAADLIHIADGQRAAFGEELAQHLAARMRRADWARRLLAGETDAEAARLSQGLPLCPGCYMVAMFDATLALARDSGQDIAEMAGLSLETTIRAIRKLADKGCLNIVGGRIHLETTNQLRAIVR